MDIASLFHRDSGVARGSPGARPAPGRPRRPDREVRLLCERDRRGQQARARAKTDPVTIVSQFAHGKYMSILTCQAKSAPPPVRLKARAHR